MTDSRSVASHFDGKSPTVQAVYARVLEVVRLLGTIEEDPKKTSIHLVRSSALAGVETRKGYLLLNLKTPYPIRSPRAVKAEQLSAHRYHTKVKLTSPTEVDEELAGWLKDAYDISG